MTDGPQGIQIGQLLGTTDRGTLWSASRQREDDRIIRLIDTRFCDSRFRQAVASLRERQYPGMLPVLGEGWYGAHFYVEYRADSRWETLERHLTGLHWRQRLGVVHQVCGLLPQWGNCPVHPLGLNGRNIVMVRDAGRWFPWLLPSPAIPYASPCDLFGCDSLTIAALAPEFIRGVRFDDRAEDAYALGAIAASALGCKESPRAATEEDRIEAQACSSLLVCNLESSEVEGFLQIEPLKQLAQAILHYTQVSPEARPHDGNELQRACQAAVEATDPLTLAHGYLRAGDSRQALKVLEWGFGTSGETLEGRALAAEICERLEEIPQAVAHLDRMVELAPGNLDLRWHRCVLRWRLYQKLSPLPDEEPDPEGDLLLKDLALIENLLDPKAYGALPHLMEAGVHRRRNQLARAAEGLYRAAELDPADMHVLISYGELLKELGDRPGVEDLVREAHRRVDRMLASEMMREAEANLWHNRFTTLLQS